MPYYCDHANRAAPTCRLCFWRGTAFPLRSVWRRARVTRHIIFLILFIGFGTFSYSAGSKVNIWLTCFWASIPSFAFDFGRSEYSASSSCVFSWLGLVLPERQCEVADLPKQSQYPPEKTSPRPDRPSTPSAIWEDGSGYAIPIGFPAALRARYCEVMSAKPYS